MSGFDEIYTLYFNDVYLYLKKLSGNESIAEEITSETFFKAMRSIDGFRGDCDIRVWLCMLRVFGELSFRHIGQIFNKTENWACVTYHRARNKIKKKMEGHNE